MIKIKIHHMKEVMRNSQLKFNYCIMRIMCIMCIMYINVTFQMSFYLHCPYIHELRDAMEYHKQIRDYIF